MLWKLDMETCRKYLGKKQIDKSVVNIIESLFLW